MFLRKTLFITLFSVFQFCSISLLAQVKFTNPSFESSPVTGIAPTGWFACHSLSTPDVQPGQFSVNTPASQGKTYVGLVCREDGTNEAIGQKLNFSLQAGYCYAFFLDLAYSDQYQGYNQTALLRIWGADGSCDKKELLWTSPAINHFNWKTYRAILSPAASYSNLVIEVYYLPSKGSYRGNILIDNLSDISQSGLSVITLGSDTTLCQGEKITLMVDAPLSASIRWSDGSTTNSLLVENQGTYSVEVNYGCATKSDQIIVSYRECTERFVIPNVFTPNDDRINDTFYIKGLLTNGWILEVYNKWGQQVFQTENYQGDWKAQNCPTGIYYYKLSKPDLPSFKGWVQILY
jgi:gliding motility-associated-like protein